MEIRRSRTPPFLATPSVLERRGFNSTLKTVKTCEEFDQEISGLQEEELRLREDCTLQVLELQTQIQGVAAIEARVIALKSRRNMMVSEVPM